jgi:hypothetical protein
MRLALLTFFFLAACQKSHPSVPVVSKTYGRDTLLLQFVSLGSLFQWTDTISENPDSILTAEALIYQESHFYYIVDSTWNFKLLINTDSLFPGSFTYSFLKSNPGGFDYVGVYPPYDTLESDTVIITAIHENLLDGTFTATFGGYKPDTAMRLVIGGGIFQNLPVYPRL